MTTPHNPSNAWNAYALEGLFLFLNVSGASNDAPIFERVDIDLDELPDGTILRINRTTFDQNSLYFRKEPSNTGEPWAKLDRDGETHHYINNEQPRVSSQWSGFEHASELMIIYAPES